LHTQVSLMKIREGGCNATIVPRGLSVWRTREEKNSVKSYETRTGGDTGRRSAPGFHVSVFVWQPPGGLTLVFVIPQRRSRGKRKSPLHTRHTVMSASNGTVRDKRKVFVPSSGLVLIISAQ